MAGATMDRADCVKDLGTRDVGFGGDRELGRVETGAEPGIATASFDSGHAMHGRHDEVWGNERARAQTLGALARGDADANDRLEIASGPISNLVSRDFDFGTGVATVYQSHQDKRHRQPS